MFFLKYTLCSYFEFFLERGLRIGVKLRLLKLINGVGEGGLNKVRGDGRGSEKNWKLISVPPILPIKHPRVLEHDCIFNWTTSNFSKLVFVEPNTFIDKFSLLITGSFSCSFTSFVKKLFWEQLSNKTLLCPFDVELTDETKACDVWSKTFFCGWEFSANRVVVVLFPIFSFWIRFSTDEITWFTLASSVSCSGVCWEHYLEERFLEGFSNHLILDFGFLNYKLKYDVYLDKYNISRV